MLCICAITLLTTCTGNTIIRRDLKGKPLVPDDFMFLLADDLYDAFAMKATVDSLFNEGFWMKFDAFVSSEDPEMPARWDLKTEEFQTSDVRFVYFEGIYYEIRKGMNGFTSIKNNAMTIRGIKVGDSIDQVFDVYGHTNWSESHKSSWYSGWFGFDYRYYYEKELNKKIEIIYDSIEFEFHDGIVVGIYYHYMNSDEP